MLNMTRGLSKEKHVIIEEREEKFEKIGKEAKVIPISKLATQEPIHTLNTKSKVGMETHIPSKEEAPPIQTHKTRGLRTTSSHRE